MSWFLAPQSRQPSLPAPRIGLTAGKVLGKAHERNRIKRRMREALRRHVDLFPAGFDLILHPRRTVLTMDFSKLEAEIVRILEQAKSEAERGAQKPARTPPSPHMTRILLALLAFYRRWLSPALHSLGTGGCKYLPTCSEYAIIAISTHGPLRGSGWRFGGCCAAIRLPLAGSIPCPPRQESAA